jgi:site-specific recombinase XerD
MVRRTFSIMFMIRKNKKLKNQDVPIYMRITVDGERAEISIKRTVNPGFWNEVKGCAKSGTQYAKELNYFLEQMRHKVYEHQQDLINRNKIVTASALKNAFLNKGDDQSRTILQTYEEHNEILKEKINKGISRNTYIRHTTSKQHLERFIRSQYGKSDLYLADIDHSFITRYETYLRTKRDCNNNTTVKYIRNLGKIIREAMKNDWIKLDPFRHIKLKTEEVDKPFLNKTELNALIQREITIKRVAQVRDIFVFCCYTGLAFVDVQSLCSKDIESDSDGNIWIRKQRHKSKQWAHIFLLPLAKSILEKYKTHPECIRRDVLLPVSSNQKMNAYLKEVADLCGISKNLTTHCARHTFATTVTLANNISMESVSKMLGHSSLAMTKKYARILDSTISKEMNHLAEKLQLNLN